LDLVTPELEEVYNRLTGSETTIQCTFETSSHLLYRAIRLIHRSEEHRLRYFLDGSAKTYFIGTVLEEDRSTPVEVSQVGATILQRQNDGRIRVTKMRREILLTLNKSQLSDHLWNSLDNVIQRLEGFTLRDTATKSHNGEKIGSTDTRPRGAHRANWYLRNELQIPLAHAVSRDHKDWLVLDGSLGTEYETWEGAPLLGIAKNFRHDFRFELGKGPRVQQLNLFNLLKDLRENQRTSVFPRDREGKIVFWYVRLRPNKGLDYPLMGVVKVEMPNPDCNPVDSELVDQISGCILAEKSVAPYGRNRYWHAHLYPLYLAERVVQTQFHSEEVLKSGVRWPFQVSR